MIKIGLVRLYEDAKLPTKAHQYDAAYDCYLYLTPGIDPDTNEESKTNPERISIPSHETRMVSLGFKIEIPNGYCALLMPRSGMSKQGINLSNCVGLIDSNYKGEVQALVHNNTNNIKTLEAGMRVCQMMIIPVLEIEAEEITEEQMTDSERGENGFGSSGTN